MHKDAQRCRKHIHETTHPRISYTFKAEVCRSCRFCHRWVPMRLEGWNRSVPHRDVCVRSGDIAVRKAKAGASQNHGYVTGKGNFHWKNPLLSTLEYSKFRKDLLLKYTNILKWSKDERWRYHFWSFLLPTKKTSTQTWDDMSSKYLKHEISLRDLRSYDSIWFLYSYNHLYLDTFD